MTDTATLKRTARSAGLIYLGLAFTAWLLEMDAYPRVVAITSKLYAIAEVCTILWLLIAGVKTNSHQMNSYAQA